MRNGSSSAKNIQHRGLKFPAYKRDLLPTGRLVRSLVPGDYMVYTTICPPVWRKYLRSKPGWDCMQIDCSTVEKNNIRYETRITNTLPS